MTDLESLIEAALLTAEDGCNEAVLASLAEPPAPPEAVTRALDNLKRRWAGRAVVLVGEGGQWRFQTTSVAAAALRRIYPQRMARYSRAVMETLAAIAYRQPVTRGDIEQIRGVAVSAAIMQTLQERGWIEQCGHRDTLGRPALWQTTATFLNDFGLEGLEGLPEIPQIENAEELMDYEYQKK